MLKIDKWTRICPNLSCKKEIFYKSKDSYNICVKKNKYCKSCANYNRGKSLSNKTKLKISKANSGKIRSSKFKKLLSIRYSGKGNPNFGNGYKISGTKNGMYGTYRFGEKNPFYKKTHSEQSKTRMRIAFLKRKETEILGLGGLRAFFNPWACVYIDALSLDTGLNFQHALNGGEIQIKELGYFLDGYDIHSNTVFEYNEAEHYVENKLSPKDIIRLNQIRTHLNCKILLYNEKFNTLEEF